MVRQRRGVMACEPIEAHETVGGARSGMSYELVLQYAGEISNATARADITQTLHYLLHSGSCRVSIDCNAHNMQDGG